MGRDGPNPQPMPGDRDELLAKFHRCDYAQIKRYRIKQMSVNHLVDPIFDTQAVQLLRKLLGRTQGTLQAP